MSLRDDCIEAMAKAWVVYEGDSWDDINASGMAAIRACVEREFDAVLDVLADRSDEWWDAWFDSSRDLYDSLNDDHIRQLIAVLRGDTE